MNSIRFLPMIEKPINGSTKMIYFFVLKKKKKKIIVSNFYLSFSQLKSFFLVKKKQDQFVEYYNFSSKKIVKVLKYGKNDKNY